MTKRSRLRSAYNGAIHVLIGVLVLVYSVVAMLAELSQSEVFSSFLFYQITLEFVILLFGLWYLKVSLFNPERKFIGSIISIALVLFGLFPLMNQGGLLKFLPFTVELEVSTFLLGMLLFISSLFFIVDQFFTMFGKEYA